MFTIFCHPLFLSYKTPFFSKTTVFYVLATILTFVPPLLITYRSQGFWRKIETYEEQPDIHFLHQLILILETDQPDNRIGWSTMQNFNHLIADSARVPTVRSYEDDWNRDGKMDGLHFTLEMPVTSNENIYSISLFLLFDVKLHRFSSVHMQGLGLVQATSGLPGSGFKYTGDLNLVQKQALAHKGRDNRFQAPIFDSTSVFAEDFDFPEILRNYNHRNLTVRLTNDYSIWDRGNGGSALPFIADIRINYPVQTITYHPGFWQMMKWAWVQYVSVLIVFIAIFRQIKTFVFRKQILPTFPSFASHEIAILKSKPL